jgi:hypothetical protein
MMLFYPCPEEGDSYPRLRESGELEIEFAKTPSNPPVEQRLMRLLRRLGYWTHRALISEARDGTGLALRGNLACTADCERVCAGDKKACGSEGGAVAGESCTIGGIADYRSIPGRSALST